MNTFRIYLETDVLEIVLFASPKLVFEVDWSKKDMFHGVMKQKLGEKSFTEMTIQPCLRPWQSLWLWPWAMTHLLHSDLKNLNELLQSWANMMLGAVRKQCPRVAFQKLSIGRVQKHSASFWEGLFDTGLVRSPDTNSNLMPPARHAHSHARYAVTVPRLPEYFLLCD